MVKTVWDVDNMQKGMGMLGKLFLFCLALIIGIPTMFFNFFVGLLIILAPIIYWIIKKKRG